jgi:uncharacterized protein
VAHLKIDMLTVCIDANVYISAIAFGGKPFKIIELALDRKFHLVVSMSILNEVKKNLTKKLGFTEEKVTSVYEPTGIFELIQHKADNLVLETAIMAKADVLVTGDKKDLLPLKEMHGVIIEPPSAFLSRLEKMGII